MEVLKRLPLLLAALLAAGCELLREPTPLEFTDAQVLVASMLESGSPTVNVLVVRLSPAFTLPGGSQSMLAPISGATVLIFSGADTVQLRENAPGVRKCLAASFFQEETPSGPGCYGAFLPGGVRSGERYGLLIRLPGGGEVRGEAVVPDSVAILRPEARARFEVVPFQRDDDVGVGQLPVQWGSEVGRAAGLVLTMRHEAVYESGERVEDGDCNLPSTTLPLHDALRTDTATFLLRYVDCNVLPPNRRLIQWDSIAAHLVVTAYDSAYTRYQSAGGGPAIEYRHAAVGLTGAIGVFSANAISRQPIVLTPPPALGPPIGGARDP